MMKEKILPLIFNKYFAAAIIFAVWMLFFDQRDYFFVHNLKEHRKELERKKKYYQEQIDKAKKDLVDLQNNPAAIEKYAREHYLMKKDGEDIFLMEDSLKTKSITPEQ